MTVPTLVSGQVQPCSLFFNLLLEDRSENSVRQPLAASEENTEHERGDDADEWIAVNFWHVTS